MIRQIAEWLWRAAVIAALCWIGAEVHLLRQDVQEPADASTSAASESDPLERAIADLREDVAALTQKVDAILLVMSRMR